MEPGDEEKLLVEIISNAASGINWRRIYILTRYRSACEQLERAPNDDIKKIMESDQSALPEIEAHADKAFKELRSVQAKYLVEYETRDGNQNSRESYKEELYFFEECKIDTFKDGWNLEESNVQDLLYEIADFILFHKSSKFYIRNVKSLSL